MNNKKIGKETDEEVLIQTALSKYGRRAYDTSIADCLLYTSPSPRDTR